ncbi:lipoprotein NlpI precursor [Escherichia coli]|nr:lipoprotein NlpI precursor [Escherichia coli]
MLPMKRFDSVLELDPTYNYAHLNRGSHYITAVVTS